VPDPAVSVLVQPLLWWVFLNGWDELFIDCCYLRLRFRARSLPAASIEERNGQAERPIAVFVPLWREHAVIQQMVEHNLAAIDYRNYDFFLGVYANDPRTLEKVIELEQRYPRVHRALCPNHGPTSKADCLNWVYQRMLLEEQHRKAPYEIVVQHDAEDIVHPLSLRLINSLAGQWDMVQVPVFPLPTPPREWTHGTYCDEFAEFQLKDLPVRQSLGGFLPSTGVGTAFRRELLERIAAAQQNRIFNVATFTEDYDIGLRTMMSGGRQILVVRRIPNGNREANGRPANGRPANGRQANGKLANGGRPANGKPTNGKLANGGRPANGRPANGRPGNGRPANGNRRENANGPAGGNHNRENGSAAAAAEFLATREYFPRTFRLAVRQKTRWVLGVSLQAWEQAGWRVPLRQLYWLWRDRKGLIGNPVSIFTNLVFAYCALRWVVALCLHSGWTPARVFPGRLAFWLLACNTLFLAERLAFRVYSSAQVYGWAAAAWAVPRSVLSNLINFCATASALAKYARMRFLGHGVAWSKTLHAFPDRELLLAFKRRLGDFLLEDHLLPASELEEALNEQQESGERLGEVLVRTGRLSEAQLLEALARQHGLETCRPDPAAIAFDALLQLPYAAALHYGVLPVEFRRPAKLVVASAEILSQAELDELACVAGLEIQPKLAALSAWDAAFGRAYSPPVRLLQSLHALGAVAPWKLRQAFEESRAGRTVAEVLLERGWADLGSLTAGFAAAGLEFRRLAPPDVQLEAAMRIPWELQRQLKAIAYRIGADEIYVAVAEMLSEADRRRLESACRAPVHFVFSLPGDLDAVIQFFSFRQGRQGEAAGAG
jgi:cellulose synthase/poly-beta-1,6-N-acetylglucosamine synthase-like glycosyltransferase